LRTEDHSLVEEMVREGRITVEEAMVHGQRNIVTRAIGIAPTSRSTSGRSSPRRATATCSAATACSTR
jgi:serine/threonine protein phosphatase PrpC